MEEEEEEQGGELALSEVCQSLASICWHCWHIRSPCSPLLCFSRWVSSTVSRRLSGLASWTELERPVRTWKLVREAREETLLLLGREQNFILGLRT